jgi:hypothetical protein
MLWKAPTLKTLRKLISGFTPYLLNTVLFSISECVHSNLPTPVFAKRTEHQLDIINIISDHIKDVLLSKYQGMFKIWQ